MRRADKNKKIDQWAERGNMYTKKSRCSLVKIILKKTPQDLKATNLLDREKLYSLIEREFRKIEISRGFDKSTPFSARIVL